jgi:hypothetical protein
MIFAWLGVAVLVLAFRDVFQTVLVPRGSKAMNVTIAVILVRHCFWPPYRWLASKISSPVWKAEVLGMYAPFVLVILLMVWVSLLVLGFGLILFAFSKEMSPPIESLVSAFYVAGANVLTLGGEYVAKTTKVRLIIVAAAFTGVLITASVVSLLFTLIGAVQRREVLVTVTSNIAGVPPSGIAILETYAFLKGRESFSDFYDDWHAWCADVENSHRAYPILGYFYSTDAYTSWLTSLGAVLDSIALLISIEGDCDLFAAKLTYKLGTRLVNEFAEVGHLNKPLASEVSDEDFRTICIRLKEANYSVTNEALAKQTFVRMRQEYAPAHQALSAQISVPQTPLLTERRTPLALV